MSDVVIYGDLADRINEAHGLSILHGSKAIEYAVQTGSLLLQAKAGLPHGKWLPFVRNHLTLSERTCQAYMRVAARVERNPQRVADSSIRGALKMLATPRKHSIDDELQAWIDQPHGPIVTIEDAAECVRRIRQFDEIWHRYGFCVGDDDCCLVCADREVA
jgi:hypothetical protein